MDSAKVIPRYGRLGPLACEIVEMIKGGKPGDIISDDFAFQTLGGRGIDPEGSAYQAFNVARRYVLDNHQIYWKRLPGEHCIKCYDSREMLGETKAGLKSICRKARRTATLSMSIDLDKLTPEESKEALALSSQLGCIAAFATSAVTKKLDVADTPIVPDVNAIAKLFAPVQQAPTP